MTAKEKQETLAHLNRRLEEIRVWRSQIQFRKLRREPHLLTVEYVEEVSNELQSRVLSNAPRIVCVNVEPSVVGSTTQLASATHWNLTGVKIGRVCKELTDRKTTLIVEIETKVQTIEHSEAALFGELVATEHVNNVTAVRIEWSYCELITQQIEITGSEIK